MTYFLLIWLVGLAAWMSLVAFEALGGPQFPDHGGCVGAGGAQPELGLTLRRAA